MHQHTSWSRKIFSVSNYFFLILLALLCVAPMINILAISFSTSSAATAGLVKFWPVDFTISSYAFILEKPQFIRAFGVSVLRVILGVPISIILAVTLAYPLSKEVRAFRLRTVYVWFFMFSSIFGGGLIPWYMTINMTGLTNTIWALVLPGAVQVFNVILLLNFFRNLPKELEESSFMDGGNHWITLWRIYLPISMPSIATITLFAFVGQWNSWFDGLILMNSPENYPLSTYLQTIIIQTDLSKISMLQANHLSEISDRTTKAAQIFLGALPVLIIYPFLQKYFVKGLVVGSVKE